ncbi:hypothetical protein QQP08_021167 [Theobroma cacao]|nr:hypothetical protein QQP08_021167 [Theobroma cacao]
MWESLHSDCQIVLIPRLKEQFLNTRLMVEELKVAVEDEKGENSKISKENLSKAIKLVIDKDNEISGLLKRNHAKLKNILSNRDLQEEYINNIIKVTVTVCKAKMRNPNSSKLQVAMFPWFAFGHFIPYLHLSNKLAEKGHKVSFLLPKEAQPNLFAIAFDQTRDQVETILRAIKPDIVFYDLGYWIPALAHQINIKSIYTAAVTVAANAHSSTKKVTKEITIEELTEVPPSYPSSKVKLRAEEVPVLTIARKIFGIGLSFQDRIITSMNGSDVIAFKAHREIEGPFCDYVAQHLESLLC